MHARVNAFVALIVCASALLLGVLYLGDPGLERIQVQAALSLCGLSVVAHLLRYQLPTGASGSIAFIPFLATLFLVPHWVTVIAVAACVTTLECLVRRPLIKAAFNVGQHALAAALAILIYLQLGGESLLAGSPGQFLPITCAAIVFMATNSLSVSAVVALSEGRPIWNVWMANTARTLLYDVLALPIVYAFARVYVEWGVMGALIFAIPLLGVRQLYRTNWLLEQTNRELLELMVAAIEARDPYTSGHSRRVARLARIIARAYGLSVRDVEKVGVAALLHDVGKIDEVFAPILRKPGRLTPEEREIMETHPVKSAELVARVSHLADMLPAIRHHHENWDGSGYPNALAAEAIPLGARIIRFADTIDAMSSDRPYRAALGQAEVRRELMKFRGVQFDPNICDALLNSQSFAQLFDSRAGGTPRSLEIPRSRLGQRRESA